MAISKKTTYDHIYMNKIAKKFHEIRIWSARGLSDYAIATKLGISEGTFYSYLNKYDDFCLEVMRGRYGAEVMVENAMLKKALGHPYKEVTKERVMNHDTGEYELVTTKIVYKHKEGDFNAQKYWLEHRNAKRWPKDTIAPIGENVNNTVQSLAHLLANPIKERQIGSEMDD